MQLDLFAHSRDVMLRNDLATALTQRDAVTSQTALARWAREFPADPGLADAELLVAALADETTPALAPATAIALAAARAHLRSVLTPAATAVLGRQEAQPWLRRFALVGATAAPGAPGPPP
jgi:hypothetical protein